MIINFNKQSSGPALVRIWQSVIDRMKLHQYLDVIIGKRLAWDDHTDGRLPDVWTHHVTMVSDDSSHPSNARCHLCQNTVTQQ